MNFALMHVSKCNNNAIKKLSMLWHAFPGNDKTV